MTTQSEAAPFLHRTAQVEDFLHLFAVVEEGPFFFVVVVVEEGEDHALHVAGVGRGPDSWRPGS